MVSELLEADERISSLVALVPFVGPWVIHRSEVHSVKLQYISIGLTTLTIVCILALLRTFSAPPVPLRERLQLQIRTLGEIAEHFRAEHGTYPDSETWKRTAEQPDPRFFDPWGRPYQYECGEDGGVTIGTLGRDGKEGGIDEDADVSTHFAPAEPLPQGVEPERGALRVKGAAEEVVEGGVAVVR